MCRIVRCKAGGRGLVVILAWAVTLDGFFLLLFFCVHDGWSLVLC